MQSEGHIQPTIELNGAPVPLPEPATVVELMKALSLEGASGVAVAVNQEVIPRSQWSQAALKAGDRVEVIRAVQGG